MGEQFEHGGVGGLVEVADAVVVSVYGQGVLDEVVAADGDEIGVFEQAGHGERGGGDFYHAADFRLAVGFVALGELFFGGV